MNNVIEFGLYRAHIVYDSHGDITLNAIEIMVAGQWLRYESTELRDKHIEKLQDKVSEVL